MYYLSVIIPMYNAERYIARCAKSLFEQTLQGFELIFVDDCSADSSVQVLCDTLACYENRISDVKIISHPSNKGVSTARNTGLQHASGKYIGWVDSDDWVEPDMFSLLCKAAEKEDADIAWCDFYNVSLDGMHMEVQNEEDKTKVIRGLLLGTRHGNLWTEIAKRELYTCHDIQFPPHINMMEDKYVLVQLMYWAKKMKHVTGAYYYYDKCNAASATAGWSNRQVPRDAVQSLNAILSFIDSTELGKVLRQEMEYARLVLKKGLLNALSIEAFMNWKNLFTRSNRYVLKCPNMTLRQKVLGWCISHDWWLVARVWMRLKGIS